MPQTMDSNKSSLTVAEEVSLATLPTPASNTVWFPLEPNTYANLGGDLKTTPREPITATRQRRKGTVTDMDVTAGFNIDFTQNNLTRLLQGFFFSKAHEKFSTQPLNGTAVPITGVTASGQNFAAASGLGTVATSALLKSEGFTNLANNGVFRVTAAASGSLTVVGYAGDAPVDALVDETTPPAAAKLRQVGFALHGDVKLYGPGSTFGGQTVTLPFLQSTADLDFTTLGLLVGEWVYLGDDTDLLSDTSASEFNFIGTASTRARGFLRVASISTHILSFDIAPGCALWTGSGTGDGSLAVGTSGFVSLYFGTVVRNEPLATNIVRTTYTLQRYLGKGAGNLDNLETISGAIPNQFSLNVKSNSKLDADLTFVGMDTVQQHSAALPGTYTTGNTGEPAINTAEDAYLMLLYLIDPTTADSAPLFAFASDEKITHNNNVKANKAIGTIGAIEGVAGNLDVGGTVTCYFDDIAAMQAVRNNADVGLLNIFTSRNAGIVFDYPLLTLGLNGVKVEKDKSIMADINQTAAPGTGGYTVLHNNFAFLPNSAMKGYSA